METAAKCIEDLANNVMGRYPLLDVAALGPQFQFEFYVPIDFSALRPGVFKMEGLRWDLESIINLGWWARIWKLQFGIKSGNVASVQQFENQCMPASSQQHFVETWSFAP